VFGVCPPNALDGRESRALRCQQSVLLLVARDLLLDLALLRRHLLPLGPVLRKTDVGDHGVSSFPAKNNTTAGRRSGANSKMATVAAAPRTIVSERISLPFLSASFCLRRT